MKGIASNSISLSALPGAGLGASRLLVGARSGLPLLPGETSGRHRVNLGVRSKPFGRLAPMHRHAARPACASSARTCSMKNTFSSSVGRVSPCAASIAVSPFSASAQAALTFKLPCVTIHTASAALGLAACRVRELLDDGRLRAFDVSLRARAHREVRILVADLAALQRGERNPGGFESALHIIFPVLASPVAPKTLRAVTVYRRLLISHTLLFWLVDRGELRLAGGPPRCGPTGSPPITVASLTAFLQRRFLQ